VSISNKYGVSIAITCLALLILISCSHKAAWAAQVQIAWNPSQDQEVSGYRVYHGTQSRTYSNIDDAKANLTYKISNVPDTAPYYIAVTAYSSDAESDFSEELVVYSIRSSSSANGQILPSGTSIFAQGSSSTFSITPDTGYVIADVLVDGVSVGPVSRYTLSNLNACHTISAVFSSSSSDNTPATFTISADARTGGTISPSGNTTVSSGSSLKYSITPSAGYKTADVTVDGVSMGALSSYSFTKITANHTIVAKFQPIAYTISAAAQYGGTITPAGNVPVSAGASTTFQIAPASGFRISNILVDGVSAGAAASYTFSGISGNHSIVARFESVNLSPVADAGPDQIVQSGKTVTLNGANSTAPKGIAAYSWKQTSGPSVSVSNPLSPVCAFKAPSVTSGTLIIFQLNIVDKAGKAASANCFINITGTDSAPAADARQNQSVSPYSLVTLNGVRSSDPDDGISSYQWVQTAGPAVSLSNADTAQASFVAPDAGTSGTTLAFKLVVRDHFGLRARDYCLVTVVGNYSAPIAGAGQDRTVYPLASVILDASGSTDPNSGAVTYRWTQTGGRPVTLSDPLSPRPSFTAPNSNTGAAPLVFRVTVTNKFGLSSSDKCLVNVVGQNGQ